uniref:14-3-3 protein gamma-like n=1 Tax=Ciona intestinalis TaxID=7719 RepID=F6S1Q4_CIOIN|nr:14-3-3 protein gamma-like [Ciona intestinalis]|eukprot:XP_026696725.1 14-3-3 protein gamma-like [Ciona intestinalis]
MEQTDNAEVAPEVPVDAERAELVEKAKMSEQAERYDDMVESMKKVAQKDTKLQAEERNLLSVAFKNVVGARRSSWRVIATIVGKETEERKVQLNTAYLSKITSEIEAICKDVVELIDTSLLSRDDLEVDSKTFYMKMKGDYFRYVAEVLKDEKKTAFGEKANASYSEAYDLCKSEMPASHPIRLGLALNYSVFYYEILSDSKQALLIAQTAFDEAVKNMDDLPSSTYKDSTLIMQLLRDNITLWTADAPSEDKSDDGNEEDAA